MGSAWFFILLLGITGSLCQVAVDMSPKDPLVLEGQNLTILCRIGMPMNYCRFEIPGVPQGGLNLAVDTRVAGLTYYGAGLDKGQCGVTIARVSKENLGVIKCQLGTTPFDSVGTTNIIVASPPNRPDLEVSRGSQNRNEYRMNDILQARCNVRDGRPAANITWYLGDDIIYEGLTQPQIVENAQHSGYSNGLATTTQNLTRQLQASDNGKALRCQAEHIAYPGGRQSIEHQLKVQYPPLPQGIPIEIFGVQLGGPAYINVTIDANPKPTLEWFIASESVTEGSTDRSGRFEATSAQPLHWSGKYNASLRVADLTIEDTQIEYRLKANNEQGTTEYIIRISSSEEPQGAALDPGAIIGIVVALAVVLIAVVLIIFARATGRWCFSAKSEIPRTKTAGETVTDTPGVTDSLLGQPQTTNPSSVIIPKSSSAAEAVFYKPLPSGNPNEIGIPIEQAVHVTRSPSDYTSSVASSESDYPIPVSRVPAYPGPKYQPGLVKEIRNNLQRSDTESADVGREEKSKKKFNLTNVFLKKKNNSTKIEETQNEDPNDNEEGGDKSDEVKSTKPSEQTLVYAELELKPTESSTVRPTIRPQEDKTEYAEIVYVSPGNDKDADK